MALLAAALWLAAAGAPAQAEAESTPAAAPIHLTVIPGDPDALLPTDPLEPVGTLPDVPVTIRGVAPIDLAGAEIRITVTPPQEPEAPEFEPADGPGCPKDEEAGTEAKVAQIRPEPPATLTARVSDSGIFEARYTPRVLGDHVVEAVDAVGRYRGTARFEVDQPELPAGCEDIPQDEVEDVTVALVEAVCQATEALKGRVRELPDSPAREELQTKLDEIDRAFKDGFACDEAPEWVSGSAHVNKLRALAPEMRPATQDLVLQFKGWLSTAKRARDEAPRAMAAVTAGNILCDQLDIVLNGLKFIDTYLGLIIKPSAYLADWAKENVPTKLVGLIPAVRQTPALKEGIELAWKGITSYQPKREGGRVKIGVKGFERALAAGKMVNAATAYVASRVIEAYCQQFQGPVSGTMEAEFYENGALWWNYSIAIQGRIILRYPKGAAGDVIPLSGEIMGNAIRFASNDNAIPVLYPEFARGTVFVSRRFEPLSMSDFPHFLAANMGATSPSSPLPDFNPITTTIEQGGPIVQNLLTPAFFRVPVRGELRGKTLRLELGEAATDFEGNETKVVHILLPVLSLRPQVVTYALPYKGARFLMFRAMNDGPVEFAVRREGETLSIERAFDREKKDQGAKGVYHLAIKACNPGCD
ncbi:MAG: hypothetical protein IRY94_11565 [Rhodospirillaceae bacterium]|nr:hypothetical protein [Rhodospirillaceae bacterium]